VRGRDWTRSIVSRGSTCWHRQTRVPPLLHLKPMTTTSLPVDSWSAHDAMVSSQAEQHTNSRGSTISNPHEPNVYLSRPLSKWQTNPLEEWKLLKRDSPNVYEIARDYLGILATSVPAERLFSRAGRVVTKLRNRLSGNREDQLVFLGGLDKRFWFPGESTNS